MPAQCALLFSKNLSKNEEMLIGNMMHKLHARISIPALRTMYLQQGFTTSRGDFVMTAWQLFCRLGFSPRWKLRLYTLYLGQFLDP